MTTYIANGQKFTLDDRDRVIVVRDGKQVVMGYNHGRPWAEALRAGGVRG